MRSFITLASCQHFARFSASRPMPCVSVANIDIAPMSCNMSSAAMVCGRTRISAKATSSGTPKLRKCASMVIGTPSSSPAGVNGLVGLVEEGSTFSMPLTRIRSGAWPPPEPSV